MKPATRAIGAMAEALALKMLEGKGLRCLARNFRCRSGEIDLIMRHGSVIVFVEVRCRRDHPTAALTSVDRTKQRKLRRSAETFLLQHPELGRRACRFDVVAVSGESPDLELCWIADAFGAP